MVVVVCIGVSWFYGAYIVYWVMVPADPGSPGKGPLNVCVCVIEAVYSSACRNQKLDAST